MIYREIVHTCSNSYVADAAVISIGGDIARAVADDANRHAMSRGAYAAKLVREFASHADDGDQRGVLAAAQRLAAADPQRPALHPRARHGHRDAAGLDDRLASPSRMTPWRRVGISATMRE